MGKKRVSASLGVTPADGAAPATPAPGAAGTGPSESSTAAKGDEDPQTAAESRLRTIVEGMPVMLDAFDDRRLVAAWNAECERVTGYRAEELVGNPDAMAMLYPDPTYRAKMIEEWVARGSDYRNWAWEITCKDGTKRTIEWSNVSNSLPIPGWATWGIGVDVTERLKLEAKLRRSQKMEALGQLAGGVAHDFNNLLTVINTAASEIAGALEGTTSPLLESAAMIVEAGNRAAQLTQQLLLFSRRAPLRAEVLDLNGLVDRSALMLSRLLGERIVLQLELAADRATTRINAGRIEQVILNLCLNARDAMPEGGRIVIGTRVVAFDAVAVRAHPEIREGRFLELSVADEGVGMSAEVEAHIFEPFFTTKPPGRGTGLGLATVFGIVQEAGGFITWDSSPGHGTAMRIYLPQVEAAPAEKPAPPPPVEAKARGAETILVVEDEDAVREVVRRSLAARGYRVLVASGGREALEIAEANGGAIDLLLSDLMMPEMTGRETAESLRRRFPDLPVLFMSGYSEEFPLSGDSDRTIRLLQKPFSQQQLFEEVRRALDDARGRTAR